MFITSIVTFVASLTISLGVAFALADPTSAVGLEEFKYDMTTETKVEQELTFDPANAYRGKIVDSTNPSNDAIFVHDYNSIQYYDGVLSYSIKLVKVAVTNNSDSNISIKFNVSVDDTATNQFLSGSVHCVSGTESDHSWEDLGKNKSTGSIAVKANSVAYFVVATYVDDTLDLNGTVSFATSKTMKIVITKQGI